jgi:hypothetical protein
MSRINTSNPFAGNRVRYEKSGQSTSQMTVAVCCPHQNPIASVAYCVKQPVLIETQSTLYRMSQTRSRPCPIRASRDGFAKKTRLKITDFTVSLAQCQIPAIAMHLIG